MDMNKGSFDLFRKALKSQLSVLADDFQVDIDPGNINYNDTSFIIKIKLPNRTVNGIPGQQAEYQRLCGRYMLPPSSYRTVVEYNGQKWTISGINPRKRCYPIELKCQDGRMACFNATHVRSLLNIGR